MEVVMRRRFPFLAILLAVLLLPPRAFAVSYSAFTVLDLNNLSFNGISLTNLSSINGLQVQANDVAGPNGHQGDGAAFFTPWENHTEVNSISGVVTAVTVADQSKLSTSLSMSLCCTGTTGDPYSSRFGSFVTNEAGNITVAIPFTLEHSGIPSPITGFFSIAWASLSLSGLSTSAQLDAAFGNGSRFGTLSLTRFFGAGETGLFGIETSINASYRAVPLPNMLWPTVAGIVAMFLIAEVKRRRMQAERLT
jgi:hypothetical protein